MNSNRFTITAALPYANGPVHIGHLAGVYIPADIFARFLRLNQKEVAFVCGTDEHGVPITIKAKKEGVSPQEIVDRYYAQIKTSFQQFGITFDIFSRTTSPVHKKTASDFFINLNENQKFLTNTSEQFYDEAENQFLADRYITGTCPYCGYEEAYGDQCESCGRTLSPTDLINPKSAISGNKPIMKETTHWYLPLDQYEEFLRNWIVGEHSNDWKPNVVGQVKSWLDSGLQPRAVTRDLDWGIPVPVEGAEGKVLYVWFDAPIGYISATKEWAEEKGMDWKPFWKDPNTELIHFIGKDNIVFHCIIFPSMLKAHGDFILPSQVPANEFLNLENRKISTSRNWAVWLHEYLEDFPNQQDVLRYVLTANMPETKDNNFTWGDFQTKNNSELVAIYGNFVNRVVVLTQKYYGGKVPKAENLTETDEKVLKEVQQAPEKVAQFLSQYKFRDALAEMMNIARIGNKYLADEEPWKLVKTDEDRTKTIMNTALQVASVLAFISEPFLPFTTVKLKQMFNFTENRNWEEIRKLPILVEGHIINQAELLFQKIEDEQINAQLQKLEEPKMKEETHITPQKKECTFDDFTKIDLRVGTILEAKKVEKADKLLELKVDTGIDIRTIVSGIAEHFSPEDLVGKRVTVLVNLAPRKIRGVESQGMILFADTEEGKLVFVNPDQDAENGSTIA